MYARRAHVRAGAADFEQILENVKVELGYGSGLAAA
jgi:hypothetical protein